MAQIGLSSDQLVEFIDAEDPMEIELGKDGNGKPFSENFRGANLISGISGSGKTVLLKNILHPLLANFLPDEMSLLLVDIGTGNEMKEFAADPHLYHGTIFNSIDPFSQFLDNELPREIEERRAQRMANKYDSIPIMLIAFNDFDAVADALGPEKAREIVKFLAWKGMENKIFSLIVSLRAFRPIFTGSMAHMLKAFSVTGFKGFRDTCTIDFAKTRDYDFNQGLIKSGLVNKVLLYGKNGSGKSNFGFAIMDITTHLTDNQRDPGNYLFSLNGDCAFGVISFCYVFQFEKDEIVYEYEKGESMLLLWEKIYVNQKLVFSYDYRTNKMDNSLPEISNYNAQALLRRNINNSVIKTIYGFSAHLPETSPIRLIYEFATGMLWFRSLGAYEYMYMFSSIPYLIRICLLF